MANNFKVNHSIVGAFPKDHTFSRAEFERLHPAPAGEDKKKYHDGLIDRLVNLKAISPTNDDAQPTPEGPANLQAKPPIPANVVMVPGGDSTASPAAISKVAAAPVAK